jgi:hypothetical protein
MIGGEELFVLNWRSFLAIIVFGLAILAIAEQTYRWIFQPAKPQRRSSYDDLVARWRSRQTKV